MFRPTFRHAKRTDLDALVALEGSAFEHDRLSRRNLRRLIASASAACRVSLSGGEVAGYHLVLFRAGARVARLYSIAVDPAHRRQGLAVALIGDAERVARRRGRAVLRLEVRADNDAAIRLYERLGFRPLGRYRRYYADRMDALRYEKPLGSARKDQPEKDRSRRRAGAGSRPRAGLVRRDGPGRNRSLAEGLPRHG